MSDPLTDHAGTRAPSIAVVGSGLAGLAATWLLGRHARVTVYEAHERPGMGAHSVRLGDSGDGPLVDVPLRVFTPAYYPTLLSLYEQAGVKVAPVDYAASFSRLGGPSYFRYRNARIGGCSVPWMSPGALLGAPARVILREVIRLHSRGSVHLREGRLAGRTLESYLRSEGYAPAFSNGFLFPAYAAVCTCAVESVRNYPADVIVGYFCSGVTTSGVMRAVRGSEDVVERLLAPADVVRMGNTVRRISPSEGGVCVADSADDVRHYDHVVLAVPADRGADLVVGDETLRGELARVPHESSRVVVHSDLRLAPGDRAAWRPVNFIVSRDHRAPMATIWLNKVQAGLERAPALFQTWNPLVEPEPKHITAEARVSRPVVTLATQDVPARLARLREDPERRIWPVGSYAHEGIPLLEAAAASAVQVARTLLGRVRSGDRSQPA